ncbi:hypothetical protein QUA70_12130 [Microcoleus sp. LAD1_D5]|uniref:hypothetical protein n=1 Tax=unclassified Microcoleus TaxID=2642155 RepID=UPI002FCEE4D9
MQKPGLMDEEYCIKTFKTFNPRKKPGFFAVAVYFTAADNSPTPGDIEDFT